MKLVRVGNKGQERPAVVDSQGVVRCIASFTADINGDFLAGASLNALKKTDLSTLPVIDNVQRYAEPVKGVGKFICVGLNYADHAAESGKEVPPEPVLFTKATSSITGPNDNVVIPRNSTKTDWEVELAFVIGKHAKYVSEADAMTYVAGFTIVNDLSEREFQLEKAGQWCKGKGCDTFGPFGPYLVTPDELGDFNNLDMWLDVNGERMQTGNSRTMVYKIPFLVHYISQFMSLQPGDIISTGTPPGVGMGFRPPRYLKAGDVMHLGIQGLGEQTQQVVADS
ncbi:fumarylacetoacetate hydrolase family protein [Saccharophagus degradans]|uniref:5-oxopent-3-ene-1,2,5-tricarboxylate decarboxylase n=1 Tax=Saccharophagus degradans (strain 2-40 / ATCC 43961 / DSM 17024) TaxID=203122 RepID=Q21HT3_SACD2|nr:fumarylacetoacetate hydrolase family protein [Saccharophagus degradans]ABD81746.1 5-oxopent-3-ene-1,2,5-tricarboxylate decarboxylase [Saccharophagus degradans 2-40]